MKTAHVNREAAVLRVDMDENPTSQQWEIILDQLKSVHIPNLYQAGRRSHASFEPGSGRTVVTVYLTPTTATIDETIDILHHWGFEVHDALLDPTPPESAGVLRRDAE